MISVGIDVAKGKSTVCILKPYGEIVSKPFDISHVEKDLGKLAAMLLRFDDEVKVVMEATGIYHLPVLTYLQEKGLFVAVINPYLMKVYRSGDLRKAKTDKIDSRIIANYGIEHWFSIAEFKASGDVYGELKMLGQQYRHYMKLHIMSLHELTHLLDYTMPGIKGMQGQFLLISIQQSILTGKLPESGCHVMLIKTGKVTTGFEIFCQVVYGMQEYLLHVNHCIIVAIASQYSGDLAFRNTQERLSLRHLQTVIQDSSIHTLFHPAQSRTGNTRTVEDALDCTVPDRVILIAFNRELFAGFLADCTRKGVPMAVGEHKIPETGYCNSQEIKDKKNYSVLEIADILQISKSKAYELCKQPNFKVVRLGRRIRISKASFDDWLNNLL